MLLTDRFKNVGLFNCEIVPVTKLKVFYLPWKVRNYIMQTSFRQRHNMHRVRRWQSPQWGPVWRHILTGLFF